MYPPRNIYIHQQEIGGLSEVGKLHREFCFDNVQLVIINGMNININSITCRIRTASANAWLQGAQV